MSQSGHGAMLPLVRPVRRWLLLAALASSCAYSHGGGIDAPDTAVDADVPTTPPAVPPAAILRGTRGVVSRDGTRVVTSDSTLDTSRGRAFVYRRDGADWIEEAQLAVPPPEWSGLGSTLAASAAVDYVFLGSPHEVVAGHHDAGAIHVFQRVGETWTHVGRITAPEPATELGFWRREPVRRRDRQHGARGAPRRER